MKNCQGMALVASPYLNDPHFMRTVIYILQHDEEGAFGLVLNRPLNLSVGQLLGEMMDSTIENEEPVFYGGPVDGLVLMMQAAIGSPNDSKMVVLSKDRDHITQMADKKNSGTCSVRLFDGYSGWGPSQLDSELDEGSWLVWDIEPHQLFSDPNELWQRAIRQIGRDVISTGIDGGEWTTDPSRN